MMADVFAQLKWAGVNCEIAPEFIKESVWEKREKVYTDQYYVFGQQHYRLTRLLNEVDIILTDSPLLLSSIYKPEGAPPSFDRLVFDVFNTFDNINFFIEREKVYNPSGRLQTEAEARQKDVEIRTYLEDKRIHHITLLGNHKNAIEASKYILTKLNRGEGL
jgi:hypothetical protein